MCSTMDWQKSFLMSMPIARKPCFLAKTRLVPLPPNGSRTTPFCGVVESIGIRTSSSEKRALCLWLRRAGGISQVSGGGRMLPVSDLRPTASLLKKYQRDLTR